MFKNKKFIIGFSVIIISVFSYLILAGSDSGNPDKRPANARQSRDELNADAPETNDIKPAKVQEDNLLELRFSNAENQVSKPDDIAIEKAVICLDVRNRAPQGETQQVDPRTNIIFCWASVSNGQGRKIRYIWYLGNNASASQWLTVTTNKFKAWCPKYINYSMTGPARVDIVDQGGRILKSVVFEIVRTKTSKSQIKYS